MTVVAATRDSSSPAEFSEHDWQMLIEAIELKWCTPFLGSGACYGMLPTGRSLASSWADELGYPFKDDDNLPRVAQYFALMRGADQPRARIARAFLPVKPDFNRPNEIHSLVARMGCKVYITTNYDDFMMQALRQIPGCTPFAEICQWRMTGTSQRRRSDSRVPTAESPLVFHLHGALTEPETMVITEDDYLDFLISVSEHQELIPKQVQKALANSTLLFLGYSLDDPDFKFLFRRLAMYTRLTGVRHIAVQLEPAKSNEPTEEEILRAEKQRIYLQDRFRLQALKMYWGSCEQFASELASRWGKRS
jgi:hypothetical protein